MPDEKNSHKLLVNGPALSALRIARSHATCGDLSRALGRKLSDDTLGRWEQSPTRPQHAFRSKLSIAADFFDVALETLVVHEGPLSPTVRSCAGTWRARGDDIAVEGHFEYPNGPKWFEADVTLRVDGETVIAQGVDHNQDLLSFFGYVREAGNFIVGTYTIANDRLHDYGTVILHFESCGKRMTGFYVGRDTGQGSTYILGSMTMKRIED